MMPLVKAIPAILSMVMALNAAASPGNPGDTAVRFLEKIRTRNLNLEPGTDTALSVHTSESKRDEIARRIQRMARDLGSDPLEVGDVKTDGDYAGVLVRKIGGYDPSRLDVFPVALVKRESGWTAAPLPASFENVGIGYAKALRERIQSLETWMLHQRAFDLEKLREQSAERMRNNIEKTLPAATLRGFDAPAAADAFLDACERRSQPEILGLMGGLSSQLPPDWPLRLKSAETAVAEPDAAHRPWRLLMAPEVLRVKVYEENEEDFAMVSIACLDPAGNPPDFKQPRVELVHLELSKTKDAFWRVDPSMSFLEGTVSESDPDGEDLDTNLLDLFPAKIALKFPVSPTTTAVAAKNALLAAFDDKNPASWAKLIRHQGDPPDARASCANAARIWWEARDRLSGRRVVPLSFHETAETAAAACQFFDPRNPDKLDLRMLYFEKTPMGWLWAATPSDAIRDTLTEWTASQLTEWQDGWQQTLLADCPVIDPLPTQEPPSEEDARKVVATWLKAIREGDVTAALNLTARLKAPDSDQTLLRNLGYELTGTRRSTLPTVLTKIRRSEMWAGASTRLVSADSTTFPFYPLVSTATGPRILLEVDLLASDNRSRDYLNKTSLNRLRKFHPEAAEDLKKLFAEHQSESPTAATP